MDNNRIVLTEVFAEIFEHRINAKKVCRDKKQEQSVDHVLNQVL